MVRFAGLPAREGALTVGQLNILRWIEDAPEPFDSTLGMWLAFPDGTSVADVVDSLAVLLARHEGLRTAFDLDGRRQRVIATGAVTVELFEVGPADPAPMEREAIATELGRGWRPDAGCGPRQLPIWCALAVRGGKAFAGHVRLSHLVADDQAVALVEREFQQLIRDPAARVPGAPRHQPVDQAELEQSAPLRRRIEQALNHRRTHLHQMPPWLYPTRRAEVPAESIAVDMRSRAAALALRRVAARTGRSRPSAVLAAVCALLSHRCGVPELVFPTLASNRFDRHLYDHVGTLVQTVLTRVEVGTASFDELVRRAWLAVASASARGMPDVDRRCELDRRVAWERGIHFCFEPMFNSPVVDSPDGREQPAAGQSHDALAETTFAPRPMRRMLGLLRFDLYDYRDVMHLRLWSGDTSRLSADGAASVLRAVEGLLVAVADGDLDHRQLGRAMRLAPMSPGPDWLRVDSTWVELSSVQALLDEAFGAGQARIFREVDGRQLVAYVAASPSVATAAEAHARCMAVLPGRHMAIAPRHYVVCRAAPAAPADPPDLVAPAAPGDLAAPAGQLDLAGPAAPAASVGPPAGWRSVLSEGSGRVGVAADPTGSSEAAGVADSRSARPPARSSAT